jgi:DNA-binding LytR/AlgR family response regulator
MAEAPVRPLRGRRLLVVEDDYMVAVELARSLEEMGAQVIGPVGSVKDALAMVEMADARVDAAVLDINLHDERVYPVADALAGRGVPFVFVTGYDALAIPEPYVSWAPRLQKPVDKALLARALVRSWAS